jgi:hypothetical protein
VKPQSAAVASKLVDRGKPEIAPELRGLLVGLGLLEHLLPHDFLSLPGLVPPPLVNLVLVHLQLF